MMHPLLNLAAFGAAFAWFGWEALRPQGARPGRCILALALMLATAVMAGGNQ
jgi:hypothetical protein